MPLPLLKPECLDEYKDFTDSYGKNDLIKPIDQDCPNLILKCSQSFQRSLSKPPFSLLETRVQAILTVKEWLFPRLLYTQRQISSSQLSDLEQYFEKHNYICGVKLDNYPDIYQQEKKSFYSPVTYQCYPRLNMF